jgi:hypothetical protein
VATLSFLTLLIGEARINGINAARIYGTLINLRSAIKRMSFGGLWKRV